MESVQVQEEITLIEQICELYDQISKLETLKPSKDVESLFTQLVHACIPHSSIKFITPGAILMLRSAHGARAFLYPDDDIINSVVIARMFLEPVTSDGNNHDDLGIGFIMPLSCKYFEFQAFDNPLSHMKMINE